MKLPNEADRFLPDDDRRTEPGEPRRAAWARGEMVSGESGPEDTVGMSGVEDGGGWATGMGGEWRGGVWGMVMTLWWISRS